MRRSYDQVNDVHDTKAPIYSEEAFQYGVLFKAKVSHSTLILCTVQRGLAVGPGDVLVSAHRLYVCPAKA